MFSTCILTPSYHTEYSSSSKPVCQLPSSMSLVPLTYTCFLWNSKIFPWILSWFGKYWFVFRCSRSSDSSKSPISAITENKTMLKYKEAMEKEQGQKILHKDPGETPKSWTIFSFQHFQFVYYTLYPASLYKTDTSTATRLSGGYSST